MKGFSLPSEFLVLLAALIFLASLNSIVVDTGKYSSTPDFSLNVSQNTVENSHEEITSESILSQDISSYRNLHETEKFEYRKKQERPEEIEVAPPCTDECSFKGECRGRRLCGNWDGDPCLEWRDVECCDESDCNRDGWYYREYRDYECVSHRCTYSVKDRCTDSCYFSGSRICAGNYVAVCGNFDSDPCLELNYTEYCEYGCEMGTCRERVSVRARSPER